MTNSLKVNSRIQASRDIQSTKGVIKAGSLGWVKHISIDENREDWFFVKFDDWFIDSYNGQILLTAEDISSDLSATDRYSDPDFRPMMVASDDYPNYRYQSESNIPLAMPVPHRLAKVYKEHVPTLHHRVIGWGIPGFKIAGSTLRTNFRHEVGGEIVEYNHEYRAILKITILGFAWHIDYDREKYEHLSLKVWYGGGG